LEGGLRLPLGRELVDDDERLLLGAQREDAGDGAAAHGAGRAVGVVAGLGAHGLAAADPVGGAYGALARAAGALLLPGLLPAARDERAVLDRHRAGAAVDLLHLGDLVEEVRVGVGSED